MEAARKETVRQAFGEHAVRSSSRTSRPTSTNRSSWPVQMTDGWLTLRIIFGLRSQRARLATVRFRLRRPASLRACKMPMKSSRSLLGLDAGRGAGRGRHALVGGQNPARPCSSASSSRNGGARPARARSPHAAPSRLCAMPARTRPPASISGKFLMPSDTAREFQDELYIESFAHPFFWAAFTYTGFCRTTASSCPTTCKR